MQLVNAYVSAEFPGIAVHRNATTRSLWVASHIGSGIAIVCDFRLKRIAAAFAVDAVKIVNFTMSKNEVTAQFADCDVRSSLRQLARRYQAM